MADSVFLDEVVGFLHNLDDPLVSGRELIQSLDKDESLLSLPGTEVALQLLDVTAIDGLFEEENNLINNTAATDSDCTSVECESVASASSPQSSVLVEDVRSRDAIRRSTYRKKQKDQKDALYKQVEDLSIQLTTLKQRKEVAKAKQGLGLAQSAVWKALANRHLQARLMAEEQRRRLHEAIERRSVLIQDLGTLVRKRIGEEQPERDVGFPVKKARTESPDLALYETYIQELDEVYARTDGMFKETVIEVSDEDSLGCYNPRRRMSKDSSYHELVGKLSTPFAFKRVKALMAGACCLENLPDSEKIEGPWIPEHTAITKLRVEGPGGTSIVQHCIMRRYYEDNRLVIVWRKFTEGGGVFAGMHADETGWNIVRPSSNCIEGSAGTILESIIRFVPINFSTAASSAAATNQFADMIIKTGEDICLSCMHILEKMLLDDALGVC